MFPAVLTVESIILVDKSLPPSITAPTVAHEAMKIALIIIIKFSDKRT